MDWKEQTQASSHNLARVGTIIRSKRVSAYAKVSTINLSVTQGLLYKGVNSVWPTSTIATLERHVTRMIRQAMKLPRSYPAALIHGVTGGLGIKSFSQLHREGTERIITRCMDGPEPGKSAARGVANRAFRTKEKEDLALGQGTAVTRNPRPDTYMQPLLGHAAKEGDLWQRRGKPEDNQQEHISVAMQQQEKKNKLTPFYKWMRAHDIQYITKLADWSSGFRGPRPILPWVQCSKKIRQEMERQIEAATAGLISEWKMPITKGHVILLKGGEYEEITFFEVDGFVTHDAPHMLAGVMYRPRD
jgi:hypothetical protein